MTPRPPGPRTKRPGVAPVCSPSEMTGVPFTRTCRTPVEYRCGVIRGRKVPNLDGVEHDHVGVGSLAEPPPAVQPEVLGRQARHPPDRLLEGKDPFVAHVGAEDAGERTVRPRVRIGLQEDPLGRLRLLIRAEADPRQREDFPHIVLGHREVQRPDVVVVLHEEIQHRLFRRRSSERRDLGEGLARQMPERVLTEPRDDDGVRRRLEERVLPRGRGGTHPLEDARPRLRIPQSVEQLVEPAFVGPRRDARIEPGAREGVWIGVGRDGCARSRERLRSSRSPGPSSASWLVRSP